MFTCLNVMVFLFFSDVQSRVSVSFFFPPCSGVCAGEGPADGAVEDGVHVSDGDLLQGHAPAEGPGGAAGEEVQADGHTGHRRRSQRRQHDQR